MLEVTVPVLPKTVPTAPVGVVHVAPPFASEVSTLPTPGVPPVILTRSAVSVPVKVGEASAPVVRTFTPPTLIPVEALIVPVTSKV